MEKSLLTDFVIRKGVVEDAVKVRRLHAEIWKSTYPNSEYGVSQEWVDTETRKWFSEESIAATKQIYKEIDNDPDQYCDVAYHANEPIGFIHASRMSNMAKIEGLYIHQNWQGKGVAKRFMNDFLNWKGKGIAAELETVAYNERAQKFYEKYGFEKTDRLTKSYKGILPKIIMVRKGDRDEI